ncbi:MAG: EAL domain-containing protein [Hyphomonadaceae bacterium]|nr:EAL domain-containing protein [Hyphomonadaceae bacterium]
MISRPVSSARQELLNGLADGRLALHFQPQFDIAAQAITGFEGVVRWHHPNLGVLLPGVFLGLAQREGLLADLTRTMLQQAGGAIAGWRRAGYGVSVGVNLGREDLHDITLAADAVAAVHDYGARPEDVVLEVNEEHLLSLDRGMLARLGDLRAAGFGLALDAKGVPTLKLETLPQGLFTQLKCGGLTLLRVAERLRTLNASAFQRRVNQARRMGLPVIAVGTETDEALASFVTAGFTHVQGDLLSGPLPYPETYAFLAGGSVGAGTAQQARTLPEAMAAA